MLDCVPQKTSLPAIVTGGPDDKLIQASSGYIATLKTIAGLYDPLDEDAWVIARAPFEAIQEGLLETLGDPDLRATTLAGMQARARAAHAYAEGQYTGDAEYIVEALLRDLMEPPGHLPNLD